MTNTQADKDFLEFVIKAIVSHPDDVEVTRTVDEMGVLLNLKVHREDMGQVIGRQGAKAKAIRSILRVIGLKNNARINLKIEEPDGGRMERAEDVPASSKEEPKKNVDEVVDELDL